MAGNAKLDRDDDEGDLNVRIGRKLPDQDDGDREEDHERELEDDVGDQVCDGREHAVFDFTLDGKELRVERIDRHDAQRGRHSKVPARERRI